MYRKGSSIAIFLVFALCTAGAASALPLDPEMADAGLGGLWERFLDWVDQMVGGEGNGGLTVLEMDGCHLDPNGTCGGS